MGTTNTRQHHRHRDRFIQVIAVFKFFKAILFVLAALGALGLMQESIADSAREWASDLAFTSGQRLVPQVIALLTGLSRSKIGALGIVALFYATLFATEGVQVVVADILGNEAEAVAADIRAGGGEAVASMIVGSGRVTASAIACR